MDVSEEERREANRIGALVRKKLFEIMDLQGDIDALIRDKHSQSGSAPFKNPGRNAATSGGNHGHPVHPLRASFLGEG